MHRRIGIGWVLVALCVCANVAWASERTRERVFAEPADDDVSIAYFIREHRFAGSARTMFVYADETLLGTVDDDGYTFALVEPGDRLLWTNWTRVNREFRFEPGRTYWFTVADGIVDVPETDGRARIDMVEWYCETTDKERATAEGHVASRYDRAQRRAEKETGEYVGGKAARTGHVRKWPEVDLSRYRVLVIEDFRVTDPDAGGRKQAHLVRSAPERMAHLVEIDVDPGLFDRIARVPLAEPDPDALVLRVEVTQYKPGSRAARTWVGLGAGSSRLDFTARLIDGGTGNVITEFSDERAYGWGGAMGSMGGIETIERNLAHELAVYLRERRTGAIGAASADAGAEPGGN